MQTYTPQDDSKAAQDALRALADAMILADLDPETRTALASARARRAGTWSATNNESTSEVNKLKAAA